MRLRTQFILLNSSLVVLVVSIVAAAVFLSQKRALVRTLEEDQARRTKAFAEVCRQASVLKNELLLAGYMKILTQYTEVSYAYFSDGNGKVRVHSDLRFLYKPLEEWLAVKPADAIEKSFPVPLAADAPPGTAVIGFNRKHQEEIIRLSIARMASWLFAASAAGIIAGLAGAAGLASVMARPIREMAEAAREIGGGNFEARAEVRAAREIEGLAGTLNKMAEQLARLEEVKEEFISVLSHDLRAPLSVLSTYADALRTEMLGPTNDKQKEYLQTMKDKARQLMGFADDILDLAKMKAGKMDYDMRPMDVGELARRVTVFFDPAARKQGTVLSAAVPPGLSALADAGKMERVLTNLLSNAMKFVPQDSGKIDVTAERRDGLVQVAVQDNGPGIPPEKRDRLFKKFSRVSGAGARERGLSSAGIGLTIVKNIVEGHGGRVWVESAEGRGSRFLFTMPAAEGPLP